MTHGFGISIDEMMAQELSQSAINAGYDTETSECKVMITDATGLTTGVRVADSKYIVSINNKDISYVKLNGAMNGVRKAFSALMNEMNRQYN
ncbi:hypothetical protein DHX103_02560 [Planococcus sp. X10-3]|uniref:hypothetical protein n=1 Tax=Planococcus sp. X10-3 TaxID=3061240 RepID=UPI003BAEE6FB